MVKLLGHLAFGLFFALPAWVLWDGRTSVAFIAVVLATVMLPDLDLRLDEFGLAVQHHGVLHTVLFVVGFAAVAGLVIVALFRPVLKRWWRLTENETVRTGTLYVFVTGGLVLGGLSHLLGDALGADFHEPIRPFWPFVDAPVAFEVAYFASPWLNGFLLVIALLLHVLVAMAEAFPLEHRFREWTAEIKAEGADLSESIREA